MDTETVKSYNIEVFGEDEYDFNIDLTQEELYGVCKVLTTLNKLGLRNDAFTIADGKNELVFIGLK